MYQSIVINKDGMVQSIYHPLKNPSFYDKMNFKLYINPKKQTGGAK